MVGGDIQTLAISLQSRGREGEPLPAVFPQLERMGARPRRGQVTMVAGAPGGGKAQALTDVVPTPTGWSLFGDLQRGDYVLSPSGSPVRIVAVSEDWEMPTYEVSFSDGTKVRTNGPHLWSVRIKQHHGFTEEVRSTEDLIPLLFRADGGKRVSVSSTSPLELPVLELPIPAYTLGAWLGDGRNDDGRICKPDEQIFDEIQKDGFEVAPQNSTLTRTIYGLRVRLRGEGLLNNKHIPQRYLRASYEQRLSLLQGLMDTDGYCAPVRGRCEYSTTDRKLAAGVQELLSTFGINFGVCETVGKLYGVEKKVVWRISFTTALPVFRLARKAVSLPEVVQDRYSRRYMTGINLVETSTTRCIQVESADGLYLTGKNMVPTHNSALMSFYALHQKLPGLYFSADSDMGTFGKSALASVMGIHVNAAEKLLDAGDQTAWQHLHDAASHLWVSFQAAPSPRDIREEVDAFAYSYGDWPAYIVVDNLMDVDASGGGEDERRSQDAVIDFLKQLARETHAAVFINLHVTGDYEVGDIPIPMGGLMNKVSKRARLILTLHSAGDTLLGVSVVKNSGGPAKKDGTMMAHIPWMPEIAWMGREG